MPHLRQLDCVCVVNEEQVPTGARVVNWWRGAIVHFIVDARVFRMGQSSGQSNNCLIDTLRQCFSPPIICNVDFVRSQLERLHPEIVPGDFLELQHHWRSIIRLLGQSRLNLGSADRGAELDPEDFKIVCIDALYIG